MIENSFAQESIIAIDKGTPSPYAGVLFPTEKAKQLRLDLLDLDFFKKQNESFNKSVQLQENIINLKNQQIDLLVKQTGTLAERLEKQETRSDLQKILYFSAGVVLTGLAVWGAGQIK